MSGLVVGTEQNHVFRVVLRPKDTRSFHPQVEYTTDGTFNDAASIGQLLVSGLTVIQATGGCVTEQVTTFATPYLASFPATEFLHFLLELFDLSLLETVDLPGNPTSLQLLTPTFFQTGQRAKVLDHMEKMVLGGF